MTKAKKVYRTDNKAPSDLFVRSLSGYGVGSAELSCGWCDREHLCPTSDSYTSDEDGGESWKEDCIARHKEDPDGVILHWDYDHIMGHELNGILFVDDCPCNGLSRFEKFIWAERNTIRTYLKDRIDLEYDLAQQEKTKNTLAGIDAKDDKTEEFWKGY